MKSTFFIFCLLLLLINSTVYSQSSVALGFRMTPFYSSLGKFMNEDHLINDGVDPIHDSRTYLKYGLGLDYRFRESKDIFHQIQLTIGHRYISENLEQIWNSDYEETIWKESLKYNQLSYVLNYLFGSKISSGRMTISAAIGGSFQRIGKGYQKHQYNYNYYTNDNTYEYYEISQSEITVGGGWGIGLVSQIELAIKMSEKISIGATMNNYLTFLMFSEPDHNIGSFVSTPDSISSDSYWDEKTSNEHYRIAASRIAPGFFLKYTFN